MEFSSLYCFLGKINSHTAESLIDILRHLKANKLLNHTSVCLIFHQTVKMRNAIHNNCFLALYASTGP